MRKFIHGTALTLIGVMMFLLFIAMIGGEQPSQFTMAMALQLGAVTIAPLAFIAFLSRRRFPQ